jgi:hypothetical protein
LIDLTTASALAEVVGGIAVLLSLIYVGYQIRQSNRFAKAESIRDLTDTAWIYYPLFDNPELRDALRRGLQDFEALSLDDQMLFNSWAHPVFNRVEAVWEMQCLGLVDEHQYSGWMGGALAFLDTPGLAQWWQSARNFIGAPFVAAIEEKWCDPSRTKTPITEAWPWMGIDPHSTPESGGDFQRVN